MPNDSTPIHESTLPTPMARRPARWYYHPLLVILLLIFLFPLGLVLLWLSPRFAMRGRIIGTIAVVLLVWISMAHKPDRTTEVTKPPVVRAPVTAAVAPVVVAPPSERLDALQACVRRGDAGAVTAWLTANRELIDTEIGMSSVLEVLLEHGTADMLLAYEQAGGHLTWKRKTAWSNAIVVVRGQQDAERAIAILDLLHQRGVNLDEPSDMGGAIAYVLVNQKHWVDKMDGRFRVRLMDYLLSKGCDINNPGQHQASSALHSAAGMGDAEAVDYLLQHGANVNAPGKSNVFLPAPDPTYTPMTKARKALDNAMKKKAGDDHVRQVERVIAILSEHGGR